MSRNLSKRSLEVPFTGVRRMIKYERNPFEYLDCIARSDRDLDVQGYSVRLSAFIANVCLAILMTWSHEDVEGSVYVIFMQVYTIFVATFISLARRRLSVADAHFCLTLTISPLAIYFAYSTARWFLNKRSNLYLRLGGTSHKLIATLTCAMVLQWFILPFIIYDAPDYVFEGQRCSVQTLQQFVIYRTFKMIQWVDLSLFLFPLFPFFYIVYTIRHVFDIAREHKRHQKKVRPWRFFRFVQVPWRFVRSWTLSNWIVVTYSHQWLRFLLVFIAYLTWAGGVGVWIPNMPKYWNDILQVLHEDSGGWPAYKADAKWDSLGYGQILATTVALKPLYEVCKLTIKRRHDLWHAVAHFPCSIWNGVVFLVTGHRNAWKNILREKEEREGHPLPCRLSSSA
ncbi:hypothetical protein CPB85DRAFT_1441956 [Mucidula mucida]|nr:hypothetical protein CPB85DRAFT_1441956 [Mucidula mucida]